MERIFSYTDYEKDLTEFWAESNEDLVVKNTRYAGGQIAAVRMGTADARRLRDALNYWLGDPAPEAAPEPVYGPDSLIGQLIAQAVSAEVARALPLHLAPVALCRAGDCDSARHLASPVCTVPEHTDDPGPSAMFPSKADPVVFCQAPDTCTRKPKLHWERDGGACTQAIPECIAQTNAPEDDPEPHDVGHPVYEDARPHLVEVPAPRQTVPVGPMYCEPCGHHRNEHMGILGGCWGSLGSCECTNNPDAPVPVTKSDKVWGEQGQPPAQCTCTHPEHSHNDHGCYAPLCPCRWKRRTV